MECSYLLNEASVDDASESQIFKHAVIKSGLFLRKCDGLLIQRFFCKTCHKSFSTETRSPLRYQKKRHLNDFVFSLFASGTSQRRMARLLSINRKTVVRKFTFLGQICLAVEEKIRRILDFRVSSMKAKGHLAHRARAKYGYRKDERKENLTSLLHSVKAHSSQRAHIKSDMNPHYLNPVKKIFPNSMHEVFKGKRGCVVGQGEIKATSFDPLFSFNHTAAMFRANVNRLFRRTWNTTKKPTCLSYHLAIYTFYHNLSLI